MALFLDTVVGLCPRDPLIFGAPGEKNERPTGKHCARVTITLDELMAKLEAQNWRCPLAAYRFGFAANSTARPFQASTASIRMATILQITFALLYTASILFADVAPNEDMYRMAEGSSETDQ